MIVRSLSASERCRFAEWLAQEVSTAQALAEQFEKLGGPLSSQMAQRYRVEALSCDVVRKMLTSGEVVTISKEKS